MMATVLVSAFLTLQTGAPQTQPVPRWAVKIDPAHCQLERSGDPAAPSLIVDTIPGSDSYRVFILNAERQGAAPLGPGSLLFAPSQATLTGLTRASVLPDGRTVARMEGVAPAVLDDMAGADTIALTIGSKVAGTVSIPNAAKAIAALRACSADQLIAWGADAAQFAPGGRPPIAFKSRDEWIPNRDLVTLAATSGKADIDATFRVAVSPDGSITDCRAVTEKTASTVVKTACGPVLNRKLFTPARDPAGAAVKGVATFRVQLVTQFSVIREPARRSPTPPMPDR